MRRSTSRPSGRSSVTRKPKPTVTAETPSGSMNTESSTEIARRPPRERGRRDTTSATRPPITTASTVASAAVRSELPAASHTVTDSALRPPVVPRFA
ncbi:Uncharacterised protein [Mycobacteroides abscessus]|nr:Uncharacterised protein [Mycobacteroides abscessus]